MTWSLLANARVGGINGGTTAAIDTTAADFLVIVVTKYSGAGSVTPTDSASNTWTQGPTVNGGESEATLWFEQAPAVSASHTFSISGSGIYGTLNVAAFSGSAASPLDQTNQSGASSSVGSLQAGSITPTQAGELIIAGWSAGNGDTANPAIDSGFTITDNSPYTISVSEGGALAYLAQGAAAAINPSWSWTSNSVGSAIIASFKGSAGGVVSRSDMTILGANALFANRVRAAIVAYANGTVIPESLTTSYHADRYSFALGIMNSPDSFKGRFAQEVATDDDVIDDATASGGTVLDGDNIDDQQAEVTDGHIDAAVVAAFNSFVNVTV